MFFSDPVEGAACRGPAGQGPYSIKARMAKQFWCCSCSCSGKAKVIKVAKKLTIAHQYGYAVADQMEAEDGSRNLLSAEEHRLAKEIVKEQETSKAKKRKPAQNQSAQRSNFGGQRPYYSAGAGPSNPMAATGQNQIMAQALVQALAQTQAQLSAAEGAQAGGKPAVKKTAGPAVPPGTRPGACYLCKSPFHWAKDCPQNGNGPNYY